MKTKPSGHAPTRRRGRPDSGAAFLPDFVSPGAPPRLRDEEADAMAEEFIVEATSAEHIADDARDETSADESLAVTIDPTLLGEADVLETPKPLRRGFAAMDRDRVREIARMGGTAAHQLGKAHRFSSDEAQRAGRKGGTAPHRSRGRSLPKH